MKDQHWSVMAQWLLNSSLRIRIAIETEKIDLNVGCVTIGEFAIFAQCESRTICILVGIE